MTAAQKAAADASERAAKAQASQADRHLSDEQKRVILEAISPYPGQKVDLSSIAGDGETYNYANDFLALFNKAKWNVNGINQGIGGRAEGVNVLISQSNGERHVAPAGAAFLIRALVQLGIIKEGVHDAAVTDDDVVWVVIGRKLPPK